jgi:hypothetical protein
VVNGAAHAAPLPQEWDLARVSDIVPCIEKDGKRDHDGLAGDEIGIAVDARMDYNKSEAISSKLFPLNGRNLPATLLVDCSIPGAPKLRIYDTLKVRSVALAGKTRRLKVDFLYPLRQTLQKGLFGELFSLPRLFLPEKGLDEIGIYSLTPYRKGAIPVVFVHGLESDPSVWLEAMHAVWSDPALAQRYQVWYFLYPTGLPIPESAARLRHSLKAARQVYDPQHEDPAMDKTVLVGHSMGGVISRWQLVNSEEKLWKAFFPNTTPATIPLSKKETETLKRHLVFNASPSISRAIFIAAPHKGSVTANKLGEFFVRFIKLPFSLANLALDLTTLDRNLINPALRGYRHAGQTSLETLRADWPGTAVIDKLKITAPHHSIIGRVKAHGELADSSDGLVPYSSSHLPTAQTEAIISAWHSCCKCPEVIAEITRILRLGAAN